MHCLGDYLALLPGLLSGQVFRAEFAGKAVRRGSGNEQAIVAVEGNSFLETARGAKG